ncbi:MAG: NAD(P)/FAD-dependent oxidoreductase [Nitrospirae bacterium]|nr:NAD(P)/FAD-dependent oxidoreductase [Nitrospirota bacterium]
MDTVNVTIIGAGVVGLAIASELSATYGDIVLLEKHSKFGQETSSRNSEVIHSGIYYNSGSLKARLCVEGGALLYDYCNKHRVAHKKIGKLIVGTSQSEMDYLQQLYKNGIANGVTGLEVIDQRFIKKLEPNVKGLAAIYSKNTGIIDSHSLMSHLYSTATSRGVTCSFDSEVNFIAYDGKIYTIGIRNEDYRFNSTIIINCAGLFSDHISELVGIDSDLACYRLAYFKGTYFAYAAKSPVARLIYPVPHKDMTGLGIHATLNLAGQLRFGPDAEYIDHIDYEVDDRKKDLFYTGASKIIDGLVVDAFTPDMAGIRPKIGVDGIKDFVITHEFERGFHGFINLIGIESPGLTASLSIAEYVKNIVKEII